MFSISQLYITLAPGAAIFTFFFFNDPTTTEIYTLSLHDALPICDQRLSAVSWRSARSRRPVPGFDRSEEHTSELQSPMYLVCRLLLEKKKKPTSMAHAIEMQPSHECCSAWYLRCCSASNDS